MAPIVRKEEEFKSRVLSGTLVLLKKNAAVQKKDYCS